MIAFLPQETSKLDYTKARINVRLRGRAHPRQRDERAEWRRAGVPLRKPEVNHWLGRTTRWRRKSWQWCMCSCPGRLCWGRGTVWLHDALPSGVSLLCYFPVSSSLSAHLWASFSLSVFKYRNIHPHHSLTLLCEAQTRISGSCTLPGAK